MPLMRITATRMELSSRQTAKCQTSGPVSPRPEDLCRTTWLRRRTQLKTPICVCVLAFYCPSVCFLLPVMLARASPRSCYHASWRTGAVGHQSNTCITRDWKNKRWTARVYTDARHMSKNTCIIASLKSYMYRICSRRRWFRGASTAAAPSWRQTGQWEPPSIFLPAHQDSEEASVRGRPAEDEPDVPWRHLEGPADRGWGRLAQSPKCCWQEFWEGLIQAGGEHL